MYRFAPAWSAKPLLCVFESNLFSEDELKKIVKVGDALKPEPATSFDEDKNAYQVSDYRKCKVSVYDLLPETQFVYDRLAEFITAKNEESFGFDLCGFAEKFQYLVYDKTNDHYDWHIDLSYGNQPNRKLTLVVQLSDPSEYEGGELQLKITEKPLVTTKKFGMVYLFPSFIMHRVTPITKGVRKSLVVWANGEAFR